MISNSKKSPKVVGTIIGLIVACFGIFAFVTGIVSLNLLKQRDKPSYEAPTNQ